MEDQELIKEKQRLSKLTATDETIEKLEEHLRLLALLKLEFEKRGLEWTKKH